MSRIVHFEIPTDDPEKVMSFFSEVFDWKFEQYGEDDYWMVRTGPDNENGINGGLMKRESPHQRVTNVAEVKSIDETIKKIEAAGGTMILPKQAVGDMGYAAYFKDPEGTVHGLWETIPKS